MVTVRLSAAPPPNDAAKLEAAGVLISGVLSAAGIVLYAMGHTRPAAALGAAGVLTGSVVAAARLVG